MAKKKRIPHKFHPWIAVRDKYKLSDAHVQMARELGLSPKRFASMANREKAKWKLPLPEFIESLYIKSHGKSRPDDVKSIEQMAAEHVARREAKKLANAEASTEGAPDIGQSEQDSSATETSASLPKDAPEGDDPTDQG